MAELVGRAQDSSPTQIFTFLKLETFPFHLHPVVVGTDTLSISVDQLGCPQY